jgi:hypothetical protein
MARRQRAQTGRWRFAMKETLEIFNFDFGITMLDASDSA